MNHTPEELCSLMGALSASGLDYCINREFAALIAERTGIVIPTGKQYASFEEADCDAGLAVSYGGDGTFLDCVKLVGMHSMPVLGINSGRLGFLANVPKECIGQAFADIREGRFSVERRALLEASGDFPVVPEHPYAFNEFSIQRGGTGMISVETSVNHEQVATYWGDGVLLSTPAGSTAYSLSVGGPIVAPGCSCFVLSPIASHNLTMRPMVLPDDSVVTFRVSTRDNKAFVAMDNTSYELAGSATFRLSKAKNPVFLARLQNISFYDTLRNKMMWGFDRRDEKP